MTTSLIPERPLLISPTLAATIGLEETVMLHVVSELLLQHPPQYRQQRRWAEFGVDALLNAMPFWDAPKLQQVQRSLQALGLLLVEPGSKAESWLFAINQPDAHAPTAPTPRRAAVPRRANPFQSTNTSGTLTIIPLDWQPDASLLQQCQQRGIPNDFIEQEVPGFVRYYRDREKKEYSWNHRFLTWVNTGWEKQRSVQATKEMEMSMTPHWQPDPAAIDILEHAGISLAFIEDAIPEFILYWRERGTVTSTWNWKFVAHVRRQWNSYTHALENDSTPRPLPRNFEPSVECLDVLAMANIDAEFARAQVREFALYWNERNELCGSWNTRFLQHVKHKWAAQMQSQAPGLLDKLSDRSWAD